MNLPSAVLCLIAALEAQGHEAYVVGGCVRDHLLGLIPSDIDICTSALPNEMLTCFADYIVIPTGLVHGTVTVHMDHVGYEVTTYRCDGAYTDHRHPDSVEFVSMLSEDLARRDFTINAMAYHPRTGLVDLFGGVQDLQAGILRAVGEPTARFCEDALRILRALRFASTYGYAIEEATAHGMRAHKDLLAHVAPERVQAELERLLLGKGAQSVLTAFSDVLLPYFPTADASRELDALPIDVILRLAYLFWHADDVPKRLVRLRLSRDQIEQVAQLCAYQPRTAPVAEREIKHILRAMGVKQATRFLYLVGAREKLEELTTIVARGDCFSLSQLAVTGRDVMQWGVPPGVAVGKTLNALLRCVIDSDMPNTPQALRAAISKIDIL